MTKYHVNVDLGRVARLALACGVSATALAASAPAFAADSGNNEVIVTGSRVRQDGMKTPVPVTAVTVTELKSMSPGLLVEGMTELPQFYNSQTPANGNWFTRGGYGNLDLRGLGINRTLTLLNGRRMIASTAFGGVDTTTFPAEAIRSVETVTGGASAAYGTDAVAGVVNFILDTKFQGLKVSAQGGETTRGDSANYEISATAGIPFADGRGHLLFSGDIFKQNGVHNYKGRDWYQGWGTIPDANGMLLIRPHIVSRNATFGGLISAPGSALNGLMFLPDGSTTPYVTSSLSTGNLGTAAARQSVANGGSGDDLGAEVWTLYPDVKRYSFFSYGDYQVTDNLQVFLQFMEGMDRTFRYNTPRGSLQGSPTAITIFSGNAFLPANVQAILTQENRASFVLKRQGSAQDIGADISLADTNLTTSVTSGFKYEIPKEGLIGGLFGGWTMDGYYQYGRNTRKGYQIGLRVDRIFAAVDAVKDPKTGAIVCRTSLFNGQFPGCQPLNLFGVGRASPQAVDYVVGNDPGQQITTPLYFTDTGFSLGQSITYTSDEAKVNITGMQEHVAELSMNGDVFKGWGAGPITGAFGATYRQDSILQIVHDSTNQSSDHSKGHPVLCNSDPAAIAAGLRGVSQPDCTNTVGIQFSKVSNLMGVIKVKEAFAETLIPIIADAPFMKLLKADLAGRVANYTGSGTVWAYKGGLDAEIIQGIRLRGTYSRDVRAANLSERFDKTGGAAVVTDPRYPQDGAVNVTIFSGGNPNVRPEKADTYTAGVVLQPGFIPGASVSVDWYRIKIKDAIGQLGNAQTVVNQCEAGAKDLCALITRDPVTDRLILVGNLYVNINQAMVRGIDMEADYHRPIHVLGGNEAISARFFASWLLENSIINNGATKIDRAGQVGIQQSDGVPYSLPDLKATANLTYTNGPFGLFLQGRYISAGTFENALVVGKDIESNHVPAVFYADLRVSYAFDVKHSNLEMYATVTNLFDKDPPVTPYYSTFAGYAQQYNAGLYDVLGRRFVVGAKFRY
jgi:outer membrane receptor protein involved in Fe transport